MGFDRNLPRCPICNEKLYVVKEARFLVTGADLNQRDEIIEPFSYRFIEEYENSFSYEEQLSCAEGHSEDEMVAALREVDNFDIVYAVKMRVSVRNGAIEAVVVEDEGLDQMVDSIYDEDGDKLEYERVASVLEAGVYQDHWPVIALRSGYHQKGLDRYVENAKAQAYNAGRARGLADSVSPEVIDAPTAEANLA